MIDLHTHVLPGIDDGPAGMEGSLAMARTAARAGIDTLVATPHVSSRCPNDAETIGRLVRELDGRLAQEGISVEVLPGAEIAFSHVPELAPEQLSRLGLGGGPWLLIEPPFALVAIGLESIVRDLLRDGHRVVLAHPERCPALNRERRIVPALAGDGVLMSVTAGSLVGRFGGEVRRYALELVREGLVHNVTSDAHDAVRRPPAIATELRSAGLAPLAAWLTSEVPRAILAGEDPPPRPPDASLPRRRWRLRR